MFGEGGSLQISRERFSSESSMLNKVDSLKTGIEDIENQRTPILRSRRSTNDGFTAKKQVQFKRRSTMQSILPIRQKPNNNDAAAKSFMPLKRISTVENPFTFSENPVLIQQRLQTLGTSDLQALPWTELEEDGTFYNTLLKKVRYKSNAFDDIHNTTNYTCKQWEMVKVKQMKAGTIEKLVEHLTPASQETNDFDPGFFLAFLCTYKSFTTTSAVVDLLLKRFEHFESITPETNDTQEEVQGIERRICSVISIWIDQYPRDFDEPPNYDSLNKLIHFFQQRTQIPVAMKIYETCDLKLNTLTVSPFEDEKPLKFKFCSCLTIVGCTCESPRTQSFVNEDQTLNLFSFEAEVAAEQLTLIDAELFLRVVPRECLASFWSKRDAASGSKAQSIKLTVDQFNAVSLKVISTILDAKDRKTGEPTPISRSKAISKWVDIAMELRCLKNFSSLKAVIAGLQSSAVFRLNRSWELLSKLTKEMYEELSTIFSDDLNNKASRDLLVQEGTAKYSDTLKKKSKTKRQSLLNSGKTLGTVPYLGTFLTDLTMIDTAFPDKIKGDLINFEKRRKEFEIVVQVKLLQQSAKNYKFELNVDFCTWFNSLKTYSDKEGHARSIEVEPPLPKVHEPSCKSPLPIKKQFSIRRYLSESDLLQKFERSSKSEEEEDENDSDDSELNKTNSLPSSETKLKKSDSSLSASLHTLFIKTSSPKVESLSSRNSLHPEDQPEFDDNGVIGRFYLEGAADIQYKCIRITPSLRACDIILMALEKFGISGDISEYSLYQVIESKSTCYLTYEHVRTKKSVHIPMNSNMYYAMSRKNKDLCFRISRKKLSKKLRKSQKKEDANRLYINSPTDTTSSFAFNKTEDDKSASSVQSDSIKLTSFNAL